MLILNRRPGESIFIGKNIRVTVQRDQDNTVQLAIEAPKDVWIIRSELLEYHPSRRSIPEKIFNGSDYIHPSFKKNN